MIELAGIQFTRPMERADAENGQDIFIVAAGLHCSRQIDEADPEHTQSLLNGFVQADAENAKAAVARLLLISSAGAQPIR